MCLCFADFAKVTVLLEPTLIDRYTSWRCGWHTQQGPGLGFAPAGGCTSTLELMLRYQATRRRSNVYPALPWFSRDHTYHREIRKN